MLAIVSYIGLACAEQELSGMARKLRIGIIRIWIGLSAVICRQKALGEKRYIGLNICIFNYRRWSPSLQFIRYETAAI